MTFSLLLSHSALSLSVLDIVCITALLSHLEVSSGIRHQESTIYLQSSSNLKFSVKKAEQKKNVAHFTNTEAHLSVETKNHGQHHFLILNQLDSCG